MRDKVRKGATRTVDIPRDVLHALSRGEPRPMNITGMRGEGLSCCSKCSGSTEEETEFME